MKSWLLMLIALILLVSPVFALVEEGIAVPIGDNFKDATIQTVAKSTADVYSKVSRADIQLNFFGTEYVAGEPATIWLQFLKNYAPVNNASCYLTTFTPSKARLFDNVLMTYLTGSDGVFYYDTIAPSTQGVYMNTAICFIPASAYFDTFNDYSGLQSYANITLFNSNVTLQLNANLSAAVYAWWHLNEVSGTNATDSSGNGFHGITVNAPLWVAGKLSNALDFDGSNDYVTTPITTGFNRTDNFTVEFWFNTTTSVQDEVIGKYDQSLGRGLMIYFDNGKLNFDLRSAASAYVLATTNETFNDARWHHAVISYDGTYHPSGVKIYIDAVLRNITGNQDTLSGSSVVNTSLDIGRRAVGNYYLGKLDEIVIYNRKLTQDEVTFRYNYGFGTESMGSLAGFISGYIISNPITLGGTHWNIFSSSYATNDGSVLFKVLNSTGSVLCTNVTDISACANTTTPIKLYAELIKPAPTSVSPTIHDWTVEYVTGSSEEIRGSSEMHISAGVNLTSVLDIVNEINQTTHENQEILLSMNITLGDVLGLVQQINTTTMQNLAFVMEINSTTQSNSGKLDQIIAIVTDANTTVYYNKNVLDQLEIKLDYLNTTINDIKSDTSNILIMLNNMTVGNLSVSANVNITAIVEAILGADVEETVVSTSGAPQLAGGSLLGGVAYAAPLDNGVSSVCISNSTLSSTVTKLRCINSVCNTIETNTTVQCQYGCDAKTVPNSCLMSPQQSNIFFFIILMIVIVVLIALIMKFRRS